MKNYIFIISLVALISSCDKRENYILKGKLKETSNIDIGSIFVYQDSITNEIDTCIVNFRRDETHPLNYSSESTSEYRTVEMQSKPHLNDSNLIYIKYNASATNSRLYLTFYEKKQNKWFNARVYSEPFLPISEKNKILTTNNIPIERLNNTIVKGINYPAVFENNLELIDSNKISTNACTTYYTLNEALIKIRVKTDSSYIVKELIYSKIIRK